MAQLISDRRACVSRRVFDRRIVFPSYVWAVWSTAGISIPIHTFICFSCRTLGTTMTGRLSRLGLQVQVSFFCLVVKSLLVSLSISGANVVGVYLGRYLSVLCSLIELDALTQSYPLTFAGGNQNRGIL